jgi:hypothetical protein
MTTAIPPSDQVCKFRIILLTAGFSLFGFILEISPIGGAFFWAHEGFAIELPAMGFLAYLALAAAAVVGLHPGEVEPTPKEPPDSVKPKLTGKGDAVGEHAQIRPELHQSKMFFTALVGYSLLKGASIAWMWHNTRIIVISENLWAGLQFGFFYIAIAWFILWQFLRWYAYQRKWIRLQAELVGGNVSHFIALLILLKVAVYLIHSAARDQFTFDVLGILSLLLHLLLVPIALLLWLARPATLRKTLFGLAINSSIIVILTIFLAIIEGKYAGI